jgi:transposase
VFVRALEFEEARRLKRLATDARHRSTRIRSMILLASATEMPAPQIARLYLTDADHVRKVIHEFNERGFASLDPDYRGGRPKKTTPVQRDSVVAVARARSDTQGVALTRWSIDKLARYLAEQ